MSESETDSPPVDVFDTSKYVSRAGPNMTALKQLIDIAAGVDKSGEFDEAERIQAAKQLAETINEREQRIADLESRVKALEKQQDGKFQNKHERKRAILREALRRATPEEVYATIDKSGAASAAQITGRRVLDYFKEEFAEQYDWAEYDPNGEPCARLKLEFQPSAEKFAERHDFAGVFE
jgi:TolA-binding protein